MKDHSQKAEEKSGSVSGSLLALTMCILGGALTLTLGLGFLTNWKMMEEQSRQSLAMQVRIRSESVSHQFQLAENNVASLKQMLLRRVSELDDADASEEFHRLFHLDADGLWRVRDQYNDYRHLPTLYLHDVELSPSLYRRALASYQLLSERGPAIVPPFYSVYMDFVEKGLMVYSPGLDWGGSATIETDNFNYPTMTGSTPQNNPQREKFWTPVYLDEEADTWMVSVIEPLDIDGQWVGTVGHDVAISDLIQASLNDYMEGTYNIILSREGQLIVHPEFTQRIEDLKGELSLDSIDDSFLNAMQQQIAASNTQSGVLESPDGEYLFGVANVSGPQWNFVTVYPKRLVTERALNALIIPVLFGLMILVTALFLFNLVYRKIIGKPFHEIDQLVSGFSRSGELPDIKTARNDEFGRLTETFRTLAENLQLREKSLVSARQDWERTFDTVPEMICMLSDKLVIQRCNKTFCSVYGNEFWQLVGLKRESLLPPESRQKFSEHLELVRQSGMPVQFNQSFSQPAGDFEIGFTPLIDESGNVFGIVEVTRDVTRHKTLEAQLLQSQKMEAIGHLAGGVAHDFNNLLQVIIGYCEILLLPDETGAPAGHSKEVSNILEAATNAASLTSQLLTFSREQDLVAEPVELNKIVSHTMTLVERLIEEYIVLDVHKCKEGLLINASEIQIEQVILNLCVNARDAMPGGGTLSIETAKENLDPQRAKALEMPEAEAYARLSVRDNGSGMSEHVLNHIFEPFFSTKDKEKGTGLGLATVYGIVKQHEGAIEVYSVPGEGSTFNVWFPLFRLPGVPELTGEPEMIERITGTVLVAEDNAVNRQLIRNILRADGFEVLCASDGVEAVSLFTSHKDEIDLVLLDVIMPRMNGRDAAAEIERMRQGVPCLFASGYSEDTLQKGLLLKPGVNLIRKPFRRKILLNTIYRMLKADG